MDFGDHDVSVGNSRMCVYRQFGLEVQSQQSPDGNDGTHVEDLKNPVEVQLPGRDFLLVALCMEMSRNHVPFALLDDPPSDLRQGPEVGSETSSTNHLAGIAGVTHVVSCLIASHTELLRSFNLFPSSPRSRAVQTSAQASPSST